MPGRGRRRPKAPDDADGDPAMSHPPDPSGMGPTGPSPEVELILCCARTRLDEVRARRVRSLVSRGLDWEAVLGMACPHGMAGLLYRHLNAMAPEAVPPGVLGRLR